MDVGTLSTQHFAEDTVLSHIEGTQFEPVVAAVLKNHTMLAGLLGKVDELPALFEIHSRRNLDGCVLAILESTLGNREMVVPIGSNVNKVNVGTLAEFLITLLAAVDECRGQTCLAQIFLAGFGTTSLIVAQSNNLSARNVSETSYGTRTAHTKTYECYTNNIHLGYG